MTDRTAAHRGFANVVKLVSGRLATHALLVLSAFILPRLFGAENYGVYSAVMAILLIMQTLTILGLAPIEARYLSPLWAGRRLEEATELASTTWVLHCLLALVTGLATAIWLAATPRLHFGDPASWAVVLPAIAVTATLRRSFEASRTLLLPLQRAGTMALLELLRAGTVLVAAVVGYLLAGLVGVFLALPAVWIALSALAWTALRSAAAISPKSFRWGSVAPHLSFGLLYWVGGLSSVVQSQFSVFALAVWVDHVQAGLFGLTIQVFLVAQTIFGTAQQAVFPLLAEMDSRDEHQRLQRWGSVTMRYGAASTTILALGWALLGGEVLRLFLGPEFLPVHRSATVILIGAALFCCAASANALLGVQERPGLKSLSEVLYAAVTIAGLWWVLAHGPSEVLNPVSWVHTLAAGIYFMVAYLLLGWATRLWLPLGRTLLLLLPLTLAIPALEWDGSSGLRLGLAILVPGLYLLYGTALRLLPRGELQHLLSLATPGRRDTIS